MSVPVPAIVPYHLTIPSFVTGLVLHGERNNSLIAHAGKPDADEIAERVERDFEPLGGPRHRRTTLRRAAGDGSDGVVGDGPEPLLKGREDRLSRRPIGPLSHDDGGQVVEYAAVIFDRSQRHRGASVEGVRGDSGDPPIPLLVWAGNEPEGVAPDGKRSLGQAVGHRLCHCAPPYIQPGPRRRARRSTRRRGIVGTRPGPRSGCSAAALPR